MDDSLCLKSFEKNKMAVAKFLSLLVHFYKTLVRGLSWVEREILLSWKVNLPQR